MAGSDRDSELSSCSASYIDIPSFSFANTKRTTLWHSFVHMQGVSLRSIYSVFFFVTFFPARMLTISIRAAVRKLQQKKRLRVTACLFLLSAMTVTVYMYKHRSLVFTRWAYLELQDEYSTDEAGGVRQLPKETRRMLARTKLPLETIGVKDDTSPVFNADNLFFEAGFDPRLAPALWLNAVSQSLDKQGGQLDPSMKLPFSWSSWVDLDSKLLPTKNWITYFHKWFSNRDNFDCASFKAFYNIDFDLSRCEDIESARSNFPRFKITGFTDSYFAEEARIIYGASYLYHVAAPPDRVMFLGVGPHRGALIMPTKPAGTTEQEELAEMAKQYIARQSVLDDTSPEKVFEMGISVSEQVDTLIKKFSSTSSTRLIKSIDDWRVSRDIARLINMDYQSTQTIALTQDHFLWNTENIMTKLRNTVEKRTEINSNDDLDYRLLNTMAENIDVQSNLPKYFHESLIAGRYAGWHYDWRFTNGLDVPNYEHAAVLHRLIRAWLRFAKVVGLQTWIAHGSMLGWYWNGLSFPWDPDVDVQMTMASLFKLARNYNQTLVVDTTLEEYRGDLSSTGIVGVGSYLIDVGPSFFSRDKTNGNNAIDARFIDTKTGLYVDITALAYTDFMGVQMSGKTDKEFSLLLDPDLEHKKVDKSVDQQKLKEELAATKKKLYDEKLAYNCRNNHFYSLDELTPLLPTMFEGVRTYVPRGYAAILNREYRGGITIGKFHGYLWRPSLRLWVDQTICEDDTQGDKCDDKETMHEFKQTNVFTSIHQEEMQKLRMGSYVPYDVSDETAPLRVDPWFVRYAKKMLLLN